MPRIIAIDATGDEQRDHDAIEKEAERWLALGWEPADSEPGEWLVMCKGDREISIEIA